MINSRGQAITESVLILALLATAAVLVSTTFKQKELFSHLVASPWVRIAGMIQNGAWGPVRQTNDLHPSQFALKTSVRGDVPQ